MSYRHDTREILASIADSLRHIPGFPFSKFMNHPDFIAKSKFAFPCVSCDSDLYLQGYYGVSEIITLDKNKRVFAVEKSPSSSTTNRRDGLRDSIKRHVSECIDSVAPDDREYATFRIFLSQVHFHMDSYEPLNLIQQAFLKHGGTFKGQFEIQPPGCGKIRIVRTRCDHGSPSGFISFLEGIGVEVIEKERLEEEVKLSLRKMCISTEIDSNQYHFDKGIILDPDTLQFQKWCLQGWFPMQYYLIKADSSSFDVVLQTNIERSVSLEDIKKVKPDLPRFFTEPGLDNWLVKTDVGYESVTPDKSIKQIFHRRDREVIHMEFMGVTFRLVMHSIQYHQYDLKTRKFPILDDVSVVPTLLFDLSSDRHDLTEAVTEILIKLMDASDQCDALQLRTPDTFSYSSGGRRVPCEDVQSLLRLRYETGSLSHLLGLPDDADDDTCRQKAMEMLHFLSQSERDFWRRKLNLHQNKLRDKLIQAATRRNISLN